MPRLTQYFLRASLIYLLLGFTFGSLILLQKGIPFAPFLWALLPLHVESVLIGWMTQFAMGVAFWILPRLGPTQPRGNETWSWAAFFALNLGIWLSWIPSWNMVIPGRFLEFLALVFFAWGNWPRLYPPPWKVDRGR